MCHHLRQRYVHTVGCCVCILGDRVGSNLVVLCSSDLYRNQKKKIRKGGPNLFTIHSDKRISKDKEKDERERQRGGQAPTKKTVAARFTNGLEDSDIVVTSFK